MKKFFKVIVYCWFGLGIFGGVVALTAWLMNTHIDAKTYLRTLDRSQPFIVTSGIHRDKRGQLGPFLDCIRGYRHISEKKVHGNSTSGYTLLLSDNTQIGMSVSGGKAHQFQLEFIKGDRWQSSDGHAIGCDLSMLVFDDEK